MILYIFLAIQVLATIFLGTTIRHAARTFDIPLTIHNLPIVLMTVLGMALAMWISIAHMPIYLTVGIVGAVIMLSTADYSQGNISTILISLSSVLVWAQLGIFMAFCLIHRDKLKI